MKIFTNNKNRYEHTSYALHCGYVQVNNGKSLTVIHGMYRVYSFNEEVYFETIKEARKYLYTGRKTN